MKKNTRTYRFAFWGILAFVVAHLAYYIYIFLQFYANVPEETYYELYMGAIIKRFLIIAIILGLEILAYWFIRRRLYRPAWVRAHVILLWTTLIIPPLIIALFFLFGVDSLKGPDNSTNIYDIVSTVNSVVFWGCLVVGHLFFIATIVKSFSKKELAKQDAADTTHILDEFNQQSPGL